MSENQALIVRLPPAAFHIVDLGVALGFDFPRLESLFTALNRISENQIVIVIKAKRPINIFETIVKNDETFTKTHGFEGYTCSSFIGKNSGRMGGRRAFFFPADYAAVRKGITYFL